MKNVLRKNALDNRVAFVFIEVPVNKNILMNFFYNEKCAFLECIVGSGASSIFAIKIYIYVLIFSMYFPTIDVFG